MKTETCTKCNKTKPITEMIKDKKSKTGYGKRCILCRREQQREWQEKNKDVHHKKKRFTIYDAYHLIILYND